MTAIDPTTETPDGWTVEVHRRLDPSERDAWYEVYERAFGPLRTRAAARHVLTREEFAADMDASGVEKHVVKDPDGAPLGLMTLTRELRSVAWISPEYYEHTWPEHAATGRLYYLGFTLTDPRRQRAGVFEAMLGTLVARMVAEDAVLAWDMCAFNVEHSGLADAFVRLTEGRRGAAHEIVLDTQRYFAADFGPEPSPITGTGR